MQYYRRRRFLNKNSKDNKACQIQNQNGEQKKKNDWIFKKISIEKRFKFFKKI
jgi:hypothetical protein